MALLDPDQFEPGTKEWLDAINAKTLGRNYQRELAEEVNLLRAEKRALEAERDAARDNAELMNAAASRYLRRAEQAEKERDALRLKLATMEMGEQGE